MIAVLLATLTVTSPVHAQPPTAAPTVQDILTRHVEARGGAEAWARVKALRITGTYAALSEEADFTLWRQRPGSYRFEYGILGERATEAYDGRSGWMQSPVEGWPWPVPMNGPQLTTVRSLAEFDSPLMDAAAKGHQVELVGRSDFDGIETWELKVTLASEPGTEGNEETWHLDAETYLPVARILPAVDFGRAVGTQEVFYDDHREVEGVKFPFFIQSEYFIRLNIWTVDAIEINPEIPAGLFLRPTPEGMDRLASMAGRWTVKVESRPAPQAPWSEDGETTSEIASGLGGGVLDERLALTVQGRSVDTQRSYTWDRFRDVYRLAHTDELSQHTNIFEGTFGGGTVAGDEAEDAEAGADNDEQNGDVPDPNTLVLTNLDTGTPLVVGQPLHGRISISGLGPDGFRIEQSVSTDAGESWFDNVRLTYTRTE